MSSDRARTSFVNMATGAILVVSIPVIGVLIALPLWYLGTNHPGLYSVLVAVVVFGLVLRGIQRKR